jgi:hypothetical protein
MRVVKRGVPETEAPNLVPMDGALAEGYRLIDA